VKAPSAKDSEDNKGLLPEFNSRIKLLQEALNTVKFNNSEILRLKEKHQAATLNDVEKSNFLSQFLNLSRYFRRIE
jgi:hypothetical protein